MSRSIFQSTYSLYNKNVQFIGQRLGFLFCADMKGTHRIFHTNDETSADFMNQFMSKYFQYHIKQKPNKNVKEN